MPIINLKQLLEDANRGGYAIGAFNIVNHLTCQAVIDECEANKSPVMIQMSVKTVKQIGIAHTVESILPLIGNAKVPATLHLDHCTDLEFAKACIDAGFPSIMIDASKRSLEENIRATNEIKEYGRSRGVCVEGELGAIVGVEDDIFVSADESHLADLESAKIYTKETDLDAFAPAIGTAHGVYTGEPKIDFERFSQMQSLSPCPLVVHGGTGLSDEIFHRLIALGAAKINISTAIKIAYLSSIRDFMAENPKVSEPLQLDAAITARVRETVREHTTLFGSVGKA